MCAIVNFQMPAGISTGKTLELLVILIRYSWAKILSLLPVSSYKFVKKLERIERKSVIAQGSEKSLMLL